MSEFNGKVVIVTGGAQGIGRGICLAFAEQGAHVLCADIDQEAGNSLAAKSGTLDGEIVFQQGDVSQSESCQQIAQLAVDRWGRIDVLCNNAGIQPADLYVPAHELPEEAWDRILGVNLKGAFLMCKSVLPQMMKQGGGAVINTASVQGLQSAPNVSAYAASKGGILSLTRNLALDYAQYNIRVLAVNPGTIDTPLVAASAASELATGSVSEADMRATWASAHPLGRIGQPRDIADVVVFLASEKASFMTGTYVNVDGGMMAKGAWA